MSNLQVSISVKGREQEEINLLAENLKKALSERVAGHNLEMQSSEFKKLTDGKTYQNRTVFIAFDATESKQEAA